MVNEVSVLLVVEDFANGTQPGGGRIQGFRQRADVRVVFTTEKTLLQRV